MSLIVVLNGGDGGLSWVIVHKIALLLLHQIKTWIGVMFTRIIISKTSQYNPRSGVFFSIFSAVSSLHSRELTFTLSYLAKQETEPDDEKSHEQYVMYQRWHQQNYVILMLIACWISSQWVAGVTMKNLHNINFYEESSGVLKKCGFINKV